MYSHHSISCYAITTTFPIDIYAHIFDACGSGGVKAVKELLEPIFALIPFHAACREGYIEIAKLLIDSVDDMNQVDGDGLTPFSTACEGGHIDVVKLLKESGAVINQRDINGVTPLFFACIKGHINIVRLLVESGADINQAENNGVTPMFIACQEINLAIYRNYL